MSDNKPKMPSAALDDIYNELRDKSISRQEAMIIEDIIDIYNGEYKNHQEYIDSKRELTKLIEKKRHEDFEKSLKDGCIVSNFYVTPLMLAKEQFDYIQYKKKFDKIK